MSLPLTTQPTVPINYHLINLHVMSHAIKLLKLCFSAVLLYTQLLIVLYPNNPNIKFIPITIPFPKHVHSHFNIKIYHEMHAIYASFTIQIPMYDASNCQRLISIGFNHTVKILMSYPLKIQCCGNYMSSIDFNH